jgi:hypothetical protein
MIDGVGLGREAKNPSSIISTRTTMARLLSVGLVAAVAVIATVLSPTAIAVVFAVAVDGLVRGDIVSCGG